MNKNDVISTLRDERARLEADLQSDPRYVKIRRIDDLLSVYSKDAPAAVGKRPARTSGTAKSPTKASGERKTPKKALIRARIRDILARKGSMHRNDILATLIGAGLMRKDGRPMVSLASYLSEWRKDFVSDGKGNFSLPP
jgi:hypothetical protein